MQIDLEHLHYWMCAIRESENPMRTLDAFWQGQMRSKEWLINCLDDIELTPMPMSIDIHGGWVGVLASMLFQSNIPISSIRSIDIDPSCESIATMMNKKEEIEGRFRAVTADMCTVRSDADIIINTSCEHISQYEYDMWLGGMPHNSLFVLQSNNYKITEHIRTARNLEDFKEQSGLSKIHYAGEMAFPQYTRYMVIGHV